MIKAKVEVTEWIVRSIPERRNSTSDQRYVNLAQKLRWDYGGKGHGRMGTLVGCHLYQLVFEAVPGRWRIALAFIRRDWPLSQVCESQLQEEVQYCEVRAENLKTEEDNRNSKGGAGGEPEILKDCWSNGEARGKTRRKEVDQCYRSSSSVVTNNLRSISRR